MITLHASKAKTVGKKLRFEPQPHKNTLGYWVEQGDYASWRVNTSRRGAYHVEVVQGCGKGQGGSAVAVSLGTQSVPFTVQDTGHFQNFVRRRIGRVTLSAGKHLVEVRVKKIARNAALDLQEVRLIPASLK